jgi:hypothetical protein
VESTANGMKLFLIEVHDEVLYQWLEGRRLYRYQLS